MRKDIIQGPAQTLEAATKEHPDFVQMAREVLAKWDGKHYLLTAIANGLAEAHQMGAKGRRPRKAEQEKPEEDAPAPAAKRVSRTKAQAEPATAVRRRKR